MSNLKPMTSYDLGFAPKVTWMYRDENWNWSSAGIPVFRSEREAVAWLDDEQLEHRWYPHARLVDAY